MSRDVFSYDPRDTRDISPRNSARRPRSTPPDTRDARNLATDNPGRSEASHSRDQVSVRDERNDSPRAYYVRDRAYLLRNSEIHSLTEVGKFRVIAAPDLAKHAYDGDRDRMQSDVRRLVRDGLLPPKTTPSSGKKTLAALPLKKPRNHLSKTPNRTTRYQDVSTTSLSRRAARMAPARDL